MCHGQKCFKKFHLVKFRREGKIPDLSGFTPKFSGPFVLPSDQVLSALSAGHTTSLAALIKCLTVQVKTAR